MATDDAPLSFHAVDAGYGRRIVLQGLTLEVPRGSVCALLGRNGAGKTTLLRTALGFLRTRSGQVRVLGHDAWTRRYYLKDRIGFVAERQDLWPRMRAEDLLSLAANLFSTWDAALAQTLVDRYHLPLPQRIGTYSNGMQIQLAQIVALAHRPELLILDEPVASMDPVVRSEFAEHVLSYTHDTGASVLYSTHLVSEVEAMADRVAFLHGGRIVLQGEVFEVLEGYTRLLMVVNHETERSIADLTPVAMHRREEAAVVIVNEPVEEVSGRLEAAGVSVLESRRPTLQELFIALLGDDSHYRDSLLDSGRSAEVV